MPLVRSLAIRREQVKTIPIAGAGAGRRTLARSACSLLARLVIALPLMAGSGCAKYHPAPLVPDQALDRLSPPPSDVLRVAAEKFKHPILKPLVIDDSDGLSPDEAAVLAVLANPTLAAVRDQRGISTAQLFDAGLLPDPQLAANIDVPVAGLTNDTVRGLGASLGWDLQALLTRGPRRDAARARAISIDLGVAWQEWQVAQAAKLAVYRLGLVDQQLAIAKGEEATLLENRDTVQKAVAAGDLTVVDLGAAEAALQDIHTQVLAIVQQREQERLALNESLGLPPGQTLRLQQDLVFPASPPLPSLESTMATLQDRRLDLVALRMGYESQEAAVRAAIRAQFPQIAIGVTHARDTGDVVTTGVGITIGLPFLNRNQGQIAIERATRRQLADEYEARLFEARALLASIIANHTAIGEQVTAVEQAIPVLQHLADTYHTAMLEGNADVLSYYRVLADLASMQINLINLRRTEADLTIAFELASGQYITGQAREET